MHTPNSFLVSFFFSLSSSSHSFCYWCSQAMDFHLLYGFISSFVLFSSNLYLISGQSRPISWANNNNISDPISSNFYDGSKARIILQNEATNSSSFACGFFCKENCMISNYVFAVFIMYSFDDGYLYGTPPVVLWSANDKNPVGPDATVALTSDGDLVIRNGSNSLVWSTNSGGKSVVGMNLTDLGNLVLFDDKNSVVWQSFDHPTDILLTGQKLFPGQNLTSVINWDQQQQGVYYTFRVSEKGLSGYIESDPPQRYFYYPLGSDPPIVINGSLAQNTSQKQYIQLGSDGHLRLYNLDDYQNDLPGFWQLSPNDCEYPMICGRYGICSNGQCSCPRSTGNDTTNYFRATVDLQPDLGCSEIIPLTCEALQYHKLIELVNITYFAFSSDINNTLLENCKNVCLQNCSCKAAIFQNLGNPSRGNCYLASDIFSLIDANQDYYPDYASVFLKVQSPTNVNRPKKNNRHKTITGLTVGASIVILVITGFVLFKLRRKKDASMLEADSIYQIPGMPTRFSYDELNAATNDFNNKIGEGGFGSVFEGTLENGTKIAVKSLDSFSHVKKSFLAEVEIIGSINHFNLVTLIGFCDENSKLFLVYEFMINGSLDRWIYHRGPRQGTLEWKIRKKIILHIARGLAYLHEDCRQKIIHLDIKPQNILLDEMYNAKVADFGLSKLIDRNESQVMTTMRGTPGYMAPEWLNSVITEKVDVYSYGVVLLETLCGRKNIDRLEPEESFHLLRLFERCLAQETLLDLVDKNSEDMQAHCTEVVEMMKVASWCLQSDPTRRPSMSMVVKVLEGAAVIESDLDYNFSEPRMGMRPATLFTESACVVSSILSAPR